MSGSQQTAGGWQKLPAVDRGVLQSGGVFQSKLHARVLCKRSSGINSIDSAALYDADEQTSAENRFTNGQVGGRPIL
jgi:hypothetical protein